MTIILQQLLLTEVATSAMILSILPEIQLPAAPSSMTEWFQFTERCCSVFTVVQTAP